MRRLVGQISPDPDGAGSLTYAAIRYTYDALGRLTKTERGKLSAWQSEAVLPSAWTGYTVLETVDVSYDAVGNKVKETLTASGAVQNVAQMSYDANDRLDCAAVRMNAAVFGSLPASACTLGTQGTFGPDRVTKNVYDAAGQLLQVQKAYGTALQQNYATYTYSLNGKRTSVTDANGNKAAFVYDGFDRQTQWFFPSKTTAGQVSTTDYEQYAYDANGNRTQLRKRDGQIINYSYDALNRMTVKDFANNATALASDVYYAYDLLGRQLEARFDSTSGQGVINTYDNAGRLITSASFDRTLSYQYDANGNRTRLTFPDALYVQYDYDGLNRMSAVRENGAASGVGVLATYVYDDLGRRASVTRGNGTATSYGYDAASRLSSLAHDLDGAATTNDLSLSFTYNPASQMATRTASNDAYAFVNHYNVNRAYAGNGLNQYTASGALSLSYDANGNLTSDSAVTFGYDAENRWVSASGAKTAALSYDPMGRLRQTVGGLTTQFLYDGDALVAEYDGAGTLLRRYVHGPGVDEPVAWYEGASTADRRFLHANHQGSIVAVTNASGTTLGLNAYDAYGIANANNLGRFQYTGQITIPEVGVYHYKARAYSPTLGRFLQTDPIGYDDQINLYAYVGNDPGNKTDPRGLWSCGSEPSCSIAFDANSKFEDEQRKIRREALRIAKEHKVDIRAIRKEAKSMTVEEFVEAVRTGGKWDFKNKELFKDVREDARDRFGNFMFGVAAKANGFSLSTTVMGAGGYQNVLQGYNGITNRLKGDMNFIASYLSMPFLVGRGPAGAYGGVRSMIEMGFTWGDNPGDSAAILAGYELQ